MKRNTLRSILTFLLFLCFNADIHADSIQTYADIPNARLSDARSHVSNPDGILSDAYTDSINRVLNILEDSTGIETAVVAVKNVGENDPREFATELFNKWGIGDKKADNGLLILLVTDKEQRSVVFETGYGIEGILPDALCSRIQRQYMLKYMKEGNYDKGMLEGVRQCSIVLFKNEVYKNPNSDEDLSLVGGILYLAGFFLLIYIIFFVIRPAVIRHNRRAHPDICPACGEQTLLYENSRIVKPATYKSNGERVETYVCSRCGHKEEKKFVINKLRNNNGGGRPGGIGGMTGYGRGGSRSCGGSWGGGRSGGGGSITRF